MTPQAIGLTKSTIEVTACVEGEQPEAAVCNGLSLLSSTPFWTQRESEF